MNDPCLSHPQVDEDLVNVAQMILDGQYHPDAGGRRLWPHELICDLWPEEPPHNRLHVLVHPPPETGSQTLPASKSEYFIGLFASAQDI